MAAAEIHRLRGEFLLTRGGPGDVAAAEASLRDAIQLARRQHARLFELRAANALACMLDAAGRRNKARVMLADIYGQFTEGFDARDLREARALLDRFANQPTQSLSS
jgi:adenylate cyclase